MSSRSLFYWAFALAITLLAAGVSAESPERRLVVDLRYQPGAGLRDCPDESAFKASIRDQVGYDPFEPGAPHRLVAAFHPEPPGIRGAVTWRDGAGDVRGERILYLERDDCPAFARMLGFAIVVQLELFHQDPEALTSPPPPAPSADSTAGRNDATDPAPPRATASGDSNVDTSPYSDEFGPTRDWVERDTGNGERNGAGARLALGAGPLVGFGFTSEPALGGRAFLNARRDLFAAELGFEGSLPAVATRHAGAGFEERLMLGSLAGCVAADPIAGCLVGKAGVLRVEGVGLDVSRVSSGFVAQAGPRFVVSHQLARGWSTALRLELLAALKPWGVTVDGREVWTMPAFGVSIGADLIAVVRDNSQP